VIVEVKSVERLHPIHVAQMVTYLKVTGKRTGLVLNFNSALMKHGIRRVLR
jgi:GxxExxY protein